jgi:hypothetical protein
MTSPHRKLLNQVYISIVVLTILVFGLSFYLFGITSGIISAGSVLCLALGFWLTESLVGVMTGVKKANSTAIGLLFLGKLGWWVGIFFAARLIPTGSEKALAMGFGSFLLAILAGALYHFGLPKISDTGTS